MSAATHTVAEESITKQDNANAELIKSPAKKECAVCNDVATGKHFGALTCEGCKGFFRRSFKKNAQFTCAFDKACGITKGNRKHCQACRMAACLSAGMNPSLILTDMEVNKKRELIRENREKRAEQQQIKKDRQEQERLKKLEKIGTDNPDLKMTMDDKLFIELLLKGHQESYDFGYKEYDTFRGLDQIKTPESKPTKNSFAWLVASIGDQFGLGPQTSVVQTSSDSTETVESTTAQVSEASTPPVSPNSEVKRAHKEVFSTLHGTDSEVADAGETSNPAVEESPASNKPEKEEKAKEVEPPLATQSLSYLRDLLRSQGFSFEDLEDIKSKHLLQHFMDIMSWGITKVIDFCKCIPQFSKLSLGDQIVLLKGGCLEMLVLRSYFAFSNDGNKYTSEKFQYQPSDFLKAGASTEFIEKYNMLHMRMRKMKLTVEEICLLLSLVLFSSDRQGLEDSDKVEETQNAIAKTLQAYEYTHKSCLEARTTYSEILLILPVLRTINMLFAANLVSLKQTNESDMNPLVLEVNNADNEDQN